MRLELLDRDAHAVGDLLVVGHASQFVLEGDVGLLDLPCTRPNGPRNPVHRTQLVDDRALDPGDGVGLELDRATQVELLDRVDEPEDAVADQVGSVDGLGKARRKAAGDVLHQGRVVEDELIASVRVLLVLVSSP